MTPEVPPSLWQRLTRGFRVLHSDPDWNAIAGPGWADRIMQESVTDRFHAKQGRSIGRWALTVNGRRISVYLKRHYRLPRLRGLLAAFFPGRPWSPGLEEQDNLNWVRAQGIPAPRAAAAGQFVGPWGKLQGFIAVEELDGMLPLHQAVPLAFETLPPEEFDRWKRGLTAELARLSRELHSRNAFHKDLYFCHFYIPEAMTRDVPANWRNEVYMIDLHRLGRHTLTRLWWFVKDLAQLLYSSEVPGVTARDRVRFWKLYRESWPGRPPSNGIRSFIRIKWQLYRRHNQRSTRFASSRTMP